MSFADLTINCGLGSTLELSDLDILSCFFSALIHDFKHPGYKNEFLVSSRSDLAFQFNGKFVF